MTPLRSRWVGPTATAVGSILLVLLLLPAPALASAPVRIGFIAPASGVFAANGRDMLNGFTLFWEQHGFQVAGRRVEVLQEDDGNIPVNTLTKARKLVEQDQVHLLVGPLSAASALAIFDYVNSQKVVTVLPVASTDDLTQRRRSPYMVRVGWSSSQPAHPFGEWVMRNTPYRRIAVIGYDHTFAYEWVGGFQRTLEENGGRIVQKLWPPVGAPDYLPYLSQLRADIDAVFAVFSGTDALRFLQQYRAVGLKGRLPVLGGGAITDEHILPQMGDEALDVISPLHYSAALDTPENRAFVSEYMQRYGRPPSYYSENSYTAARFIFEALQRTRGNVENKEALLAALRAVELPDAPRGPVRLDAYGNPVQNIYIRKVERRAGRLQNTVIFTFERVSQFWKYDPEWYLNQPPYSREYPPLRP